jgi:thiol:disulfide interchange protein
MKKLLSFVLFLVLLIPGEIVCAQKLDSAGITFKPTYLRIDDTTVKVIITAKIPAGEQLFSIVKLADDLPYSVVTLDSTLNKALQGPLKEEGSLQKAKSSTFNNREVQFFTDSVRWIQVVRVPSANKKFIQGKIVFLAKKADGSFDSDEKSFVLTVPAGDASGLTTNGMQAANAGDQEKKSLWAIFLVGLLAGLGAFISPCIFAMIPVTVSFFTKRSTTRAKGIQNALYYSLSIILIFTLLGFLITLIFGQGALNALASSAVFNIVVFLMFSIFGISFLGAFEITLPSALSNKVDSKAKLGSFSGLFFMALTLVVVSFSCTVPFIGGLAVLITHGGKAAPLVGFFGFSLALALPFSIFAFFPSLLKSLAKSGGWQISIKVVLGLLELALALKFLSSADLAYHWRILDREVYLSLWIVIFGIMGLYLLGLIRFKHDSALPKNDFDLPYITVTRLFFAIAALAFTVYMIPGLWGAPLNGISAWLPETKTQDFNLNKIVASAPTSNAGGVSSDPALTPHKYTDFLESEIRGVNTFFDYDEAIAAAIKEKKPLMIDFTGHSCANCRKMEREVLNDQEVVKVLQNDFVVASLYVDDKYRLPEDQWYTSKNDGSLIETMGPKNLDFEVGLTSNNSQPQYVFVDQNGKIIKNAGGYDPNVQKFLKAMADVVAVYKAENP